MATYRVYATMTTELYADIEADSEEQALELGIQMDGGDFIEIEAPVSGSWEITHAVIHDTGYPLH